MTSVRLRGTAVFLLLALTYVTRAAASELQARIDAAQPGDTIEVPAGIYAGNIVLRHRLVLLGRGRPVLRGDGTGSVVTMMADSCTLRGFVVEHNGTMLADDDAGILIRSSHNRIENNTLRDVLFGIYLRGADDNRVAHNDISGRDTLQLGERGSGIHLWNSNRNTLTGNVITTMRDGFYIQNANHTWIDHNRVYGLRYGLHYMYADSNTFLYNQFYDNVAGAAVMYSTGIVMRHNAFLRNRGFASYGILFQDCHLLVADSNVIADNVVGMFFEATTNCEFRHNVVALNDVALEMFQNSTDNVFTENNFVDNLSPLVVIGKRTGSLWSAGGRGNYWSGNDAYDLNDDGIGDVPRKIQNVFEYLEGQNPYARLYLYSPVSQALAISAEAFPIIEVSQDVDSCPLIRPADLGKLPILQMMQAERTSGGRSEPHYRIAGLLAALAAAGIGLVAWSRRIYRRARS